MKDKQTQSSFKYVLRTGTLWLKRDKFTLKLASQIKAYAQKSSLAPGKNKVVKAWCVKNNKVMIPAYMGITPFLNIIDSRPKGKATRIKFTGTYRGKQGTAVKELLQVLQSEGGVFLNAPPGSGKTVMTLAVLARLKCYPAVVLVDQDNIGQQWLERIAQFMPTARASFGKLSNMDLSKIDIAITTLQSLGKSDGNYTIGTLIADEAHTVCAATFLQTIYQFKFRYSMAVTASTERADGMAWIFKALLGSVVVQTSANRMPATIIQKFANTGIGKGWEALYKYYGCGLYRKRDNGFLVTLKYCMTECELCDTDCSGRVKIKGNTHDTTAMRGALGVDELWQERIIIELLELVKLNRQVIVFFCKNDTIVKFVEYLRELKIDARAYVGSTKTKAQKLEHKQALQAQVTVTNYKKAGKGLDQPQKDAIITVVPPGKTQLNQFVGRIERWVEGKPNPIFIDMVSMDNMFYSMAAPGREKRFRDMGYEVNKVWIEM